LLTPNSLYHCYIFILTLSQTFDFFFSSRRRHTRSKRDWSSDVCSSDLVQRVPMAVDHLAALGHRDALHVSGPMDWLDARARERRSEERRVGKEWKGWSCAI